MTTPTPPDGTIPDDVRKHAMLAVAGMIIPVGKIGEPMTEEVANTVNMWAQDCAARAIMADRATRPSPGEAQPQPKGGEAGAVFDVERFLQDDSNLPGGPVASPAPAGLDLAVKALEGACAQILDSYRTWVADDTEAHPKPGQIPRYDAARAALAALKGSTER